MKKLKLTGKLSLNKETVARLTNDQLFNVKGGGTRGTKCHRYPCDLTSVCPPDLI